MHSPLRRPKSPTRRVHPNSGSTASSDPRVRRDQRWFGRLEQEGQRLKKHYGRWMDIVRSLELESFILTKLTKPSIPVNLVGPQVILPLWWDPPSRVVFFFLCVIRRHFLACKDIAGGSDMSAGGTFFSRNTEALPVGPRCQVEESLFCAYSRRAMDVIR